MRRFCVVTLGVAVLAGMAHAEGPAATQWAKAAVPKDGKVVTLKFGSIRISKETTRITEPLAPDGMVDYLAAINQQYGKGVTPENNAFVGLLEAIGPGLVDEGVADQQVKLLGIEKLPPKEGAYFVGFAQFAEARTGKALDAPILLKLADRLCSKPWGADEYSVVALWLDTMKAPMDVAAKAVARTRYFPGYAAPKAELMVMSICVTKVKTLNDLMNAYCMRAMLRLHDGDEASAVADIKTALQLACHFRQTAHLAERLVGMSGETTAAWTCNGAVTAGKLSAKAQNELLKTLLEVPDGPEISDIVDSMERYRCLDTLVALARGTYPAKESGNRRGPLLMNFDFDKAMMETNGYCDRHLEAYGKKTRGERNKIVGELKSETEKRGALYRPLEFVPLLAVEERTRTFKDLALVALALGVYKEQKGAYPETLDALVGHPLKGVPLDWMNENRPLHYERKGAGFLLYSVGSNGKDDGGVWNRKEFKDDLVVKTEK